MALSFSWLSLPWVWIIPAPVTWESSVTLPVSTPAMTAFSAVPKMLVANASEARRFTWLIDVLYDHRVKLIMSAAVEAYDLYTEGHNAHEFVRTVSRLMEMRARDYLAEAHRTE